MTANYVEWHITECACTIALNTEKIYYNLFEEIENQRIVINPNGNTS
jgi:hypothetical protein